MRTESQFSGKCSGRGYNSAEFTFKDRLERADNLVMSDIALPNTGGGLKTFQ